jgi:4-hydroxy-tetrahydrodipicolinate reductase
MKLGLVGYGRMGREIETIAVSRGHEIGARFDIEGPRVEVSSLSGLDVLVDFSVADAVLSTLKTAASCGIPVVEGTTGWGAELGEAFEIERLTMVHSPNFSPGVYVLMQLVRSAARQLGRIQGYDCHVHEWHHTGKVDSPSGTAKKLGDILVAELPMKDKTLYDTCNRRIEPGELQVTSTRVGRVPGTHIVGFDSAFDTIELKHQAHGREGFALGAVLAAEWIVAKKGIFTMEDFMADYQAEEGREQ